MLFGGAIALLASGNRLALAADPSKQLEDLRAYYNATIIDLNSITGSGFDPESYDRVTLRRLVEGYALGLVELQGTAGGLAVSHLGMKIGARGRLAMRDPEESYEKAAPRTYRLYQLVPAENPTQMLAIALDISLLSAKVRTFVDETCGLAFACEAEVYGRIGEIEAEREINAFAPSGRTTVMIGIVAERIRFFEIAR